MPYAQRRLRPGALTVCDAAHGGELQWKGLRLRGRARGLREGRDQRIVYSTAGAAPKTGCVRRRHLYRRLFITLKIGFSRWKTSPPGPSDGRLRTPRASSALRAHRSLARRNGPTRHSCHRTSRSPRGWLARGGLAGVARSPQGLRLRQEGVANEAQVEVRLHIAHRGDRLLADRAFPAPVVP